jgi:hypothetical protein
MNNPPAFPPMHDPNTHEFGMTLRDYMAAKAMQGLLASEVTAPMQEFAIRAYKMADAMLKAREA